MPARSSDTHQAVPAHAGTVLWNVDSVPLFFLLCDCPHAVRDDPVGAKSPPPITLPALPWTPPHRLLLRRIFHSCGSPVRNRTCCWNRDRTHPTHRFPDSPTPTRCFIDFIRCHIQERFYTFCLAHRFQNIYCSHYICLICSHRIFIRFPHDRAALPDETRSPAVLPAWYGSVFPGRDISDHGVHIFSRCKVSKSFASTGASSAYPVTSAPEESGSGKARIPLNPVCPVRNTFFL